MSLSPFSHGSRLASTFFVRDTVRIAASPGVEPMPFEIEIRRLPAAGRCRSSPSRTSRAGTGLRAGSRVEEFARALRAEARDPLWFLARQWQFLELKGDDAGSPVEARMAMRRTKLARFAIRDGRAARRSRATFRWRPWSSAKRRRSITSPSSRSSGRSTRRCSATASADGGPPHRSSRGCRAAYPLDPSRIEGVEDEEARQLGALADGHLFDAAGLPRRSGFREHASNCGSGLSPALAATAVAAATSVRTWWSALYLSRRAAG